MVTSVRNVLLAAALLLAQNARADITCTVCTLVVGMLEQKSGSYSAAPPHETCTGYKLCNDTCTLFTNWPTHPPVFPTDGGVVDQRRRTEERRGVRIPQWAAEPSSPRSLAVQAAEGTKFHSSLVHLLHDVRDREISGELATDYHTMMRVFTTVVGAVVPVEGEGRNLRGTEEEGAVFGVAPPAPASHWPQCSSILDFKCIEQRIGDEHLPIFGDTDNDYFSNSSTWGLRGGSWRGRDCRDDAADIYPGRQSSNYPSYVDHNCNGIVGGNSTGTYEEQFCSGDNAPMGTLILGDSATAHFHIPPELLNIPTWSDKHILQLAENEGDWPQCSWSTGFRDADQCPTADVPMASIYQRMAEVNRCNHRDYQNTGVNGARVGAVASTLQYDLARSKDDAPALVFYALIGNDVCNGHPGSGHMTELPAFHAAVTSTLEYLDTTLPPGSHVAFMPMVDGRVLFDTTHNRTHPLGVPYPSLYEFLSCEGVNPCWGWLNTNATWRNFTTERAKELNTAFNDILEANATRYSFDMHILDVDIPNLWAQYTAQGGDPFELIEPVDGFHPSQTGQQLIAKTVWGDLVNNTDWIPAPNPFNDEIEAMFGDQGGF